MVKHIFFLVGMPGVGKTTIGKQLAQHFGAQFMDTDELIEKHTHQSIPETINEMGEVYFRGLERKMLDRVVRQKKLTICSTGGGLAANNENMAIMKQYGIVIYLNATIEYIQINLKNDNKIRPLLAHNSNVTFNKLLVERKPYYQQSHFTFEVDHNPLENLVKLILSCITNP